MVRRVRSIHVMEASRVNRDQRGDRRGKRQCRQERSCNGITEVRAAGMVELVEAWAVERVDGGRQGGGDGGTGESGAGGRGRGDGDEDGGAGGGDGDGRRRESAGAGCDVDINVVVTAEWRQRESSKGGWESPGKRGGIDDPVADQEEGGDEGSKTHLGGVLGSVVGLRWQCFSSRLT